MSFKIQRSAERYYANHDWLRTYHSFSFADYYDPANMNWGALRVFNEDYIAAAQGFPPHPHRDMEILTYVFSGELEHQDSMGNRGVVKAGGVQFMSAGTGVRHSELNGSSESELHLAQMWVLPGRTGTAPTYGQIDFTEEDRRGRWLIVASGQDGVEAPIALTQSATLRVAQLSGEELHHRFDDGRKGFLFVWDGSILAEGEALGAGDAVRIDAMPQVWVSGTGELVFWDVPSI